MKIKNVFLGLAALLCAPAVMAQCNVSNLSAWTSVNNPAGKLDVTAAAAMGGTACGLEVTTTPQPGGQSAKHYVQDSSPVNETRYRGAFCLDINSLPMPTSGANRRIKIHNVQCSAAGGGCASTDIVQFKVEKTGSGYRFNMFVRDSNQSNTKSKHFIPIPDAPVRVEYDLNLSAGTFKLWLDATSESDPAVLNLSGLNMAAWTGVDRARLGSQDKSANVPAGNKYYIDEFESRRQTFIGGTCL